MTLGCSFVLNPFNSTWLGVTSSALSAHETRPALKKATKQRVVIKRFIFLLFSWLRFYYDVILEVILHNKILKITKLIRL